VDRSKGSGNDNFGHHSKVLLAKHHLSFRGAKSITVDNDTQFDSKAFRAFCNQVGTNIHFASVRHLESNGLVERANGIILLEITKSLIGLPKEKWTKELNKVVWNHNTSISRSTNSHHSNSYSGTKQLPSKKSSWSQQEL
jgi:transposase InsO family protein